MKNEELPDHVRPIAEQAQDLISKGSTVYFKWTCMACGSRQTFEDANTLHVTGRCEECSHVTSLLDAGAQVNFLLIHADPTLEDFEWLLTQGGKPS